MPKCDLVAIGLGEMAFLDIYVNFVCLFSFFTGNVLYMWYNPRKHVWCHFDGWVQNLKISTTSMLAFYLLLTTEVKCLRICKRGTMNELPVIGSLRLRTDFWDSHVADIVTRYKGTYGERFVWTSKKCDFGKRLWLFLQQFYHTWWKIILLPWKLRFLLELTRNML